MVRNIQHAFGMQSNSPINLLLKTAAQHHVFPEQSNDLVQKCLKPFYTLEEEQINRVKQVVFNLCSSALLHSSISGAAARPYFILPLPYNAYVTLQLWQAPLTCCTDPGRGFWHRTQVYLKLQGWLSEVCFAPLCSGNNKKKIKAIVAFHFDFLALFP